MIGTKQHLGRASLAFLAPTREEVDRVLTEIPDNRIEARRVATREWGLDPTPDELQLVIRMAHDEVAQDGSPREIARAVLAARVFVERALRRLLESEQLNTAHIRGARRILPGLASAVDLLRGMLRSIAEAASPEEREFVQQVDSFLLPVRDVLVAADVLTPHLERLAEAANEEEIRRALPLANTAEIVILASVVCPDPGRDAKAISGGGAGRQCIEASILGAVIRTDLAQLERAWEPTGSTDTGPDRLPNDAVPEGEAERWFDPGEMFERLTRDKTTYHVIAARLQQQHDAALLAGLAGYVETLRNVQRGLFAAYREMAAVLNARDPATADGVGAPDADPANLQQLLAQSEEQDALADLARSQQVSDEEAYLDALKDVSTPRVEQKSARPPTYDLKRERLRIRALSLIVAVLFAACAVVWGVRHAGGKGDPLMVPLTEMSDTLILDETISVGPMMYAVVSHWSWDDMSDDERLSSVRALGLSAANVGYESVYLVDEHKEELAIWSKGDGARLLGAEAAPPSAGSS